MELARLIERCRSGDELAWEALVRQFQGRVFGLAYHLLGNREDARDLAQEIFVRVYRNLDACREAQMFLPWVIRIARNLAIDFMRRRAARPPDSDVPVEQIRDLQASGQNPEEAWTSNARKQLVFRALQQVSRLNREIILLKEIQGMTFEEIAELLEVPLGTVKSRSNRARIELAEKVMALSGSKS